MNEYIYALAVSDTHGNRQSLKQISSEYKNFDYLFHMGDNTSDAIWLADHMPDTKVIYVKGNCDVQDNAPEFETVIIKNQKIILTHGHKLKVKYSYDRALYYAVENEASALLFGHTHRAYMEFIDGVWLINPGSAGEQSCGEMTVCSILISIKGIVPKIARINEENPFKNRV